MGNRRGSAMDALAKLIHTAIVGLIAPLVSVCLPLLSRPCGKKRIARSLLNVLGSGMSPIPGPAVVDLTVLVAVVFTLVWRQLERTVLMAAAKRNLEVRS
jgi:hypothetical protein